MLCFFMVVFSAVPASAESIYAPDSQEEAGERDINERLESTTGSSIKKPSKTSSKTTGSSITGSGIKTEATTYAAILYEFEGDGSESDPYIISTEDDLRNLAAGVNSGSNEYDKKCFKVKGGGITLTNEWVPIGTEENPFTGYFDGNDRTIKNINITSPSAISYLGLFGYNKGTIKNLTVTGIINSTADYVGGIVGYSEGEIINCTFGVNDESSVGGNNYVGGIAGCSEFIQSGSSDSVNKITNNGDVNGNENTGGIYGNVLGDRSSASYMQFTNTGSVCGGKNAGGIVGYASKAISFYSVSTINSGNISADGSSAGGIAGYLSGGITIYDGSEIINKGKVEASEDNAGGVAGYSERLIIGESKISNEANITSGKSNAGGIIGSMNETVGSLNVRSSSEILNKGEVTALESDAGGIVGLIPSTASNVSNFMDSKVINRGKIKTEGSNAGGIIGSSPTVSFNINSTVSNEGSVEALSSAGGIVGLLTRTLSTEDNAQITNEGSVKAEESNAGGIIGTADNLIFKTGSKVTNQGTVEAWHDNGGGIAGSGKKWINIKENAQVVNEGSVKTKGNNAGGIVGISFDDITSSGGFLTNTGDVIALGSNAGGITGKADVPEGKSLIISRTQSAEGSVHASENAGGIVGYASGKLSIADSYNRAAVSADDNSPGGIIASASVGADTSVSDSFSYISVDGTVNEIPLTDDSGIVVHNSFYLVGETFNTETDDTAKKADEFKSGKIACTLDKDTGGNRKNLWGQKLGTDETPDHYDGNNEQPLHPMVYKNQLQKNTELPNVIVDFDITDSPVYKVYDDSVYLNGGNQVKLKVSGIDEKQLLLFSPSGFVTSGSNGYMLTGDEIDLLLTYSVGVKVAADTSWYTSGDDRFELNTEEQLMGLAELVSDKGIDFKDKTIILTRDINMTSSIWNPIGTKDTPFRGSFEAQVYPEGVTSAYASINNFDFTVGDVFGVFGYVENAKIKNLCVSGAITATSISLGKGNISGIAADSQNSSFINCVNNVNITGTGNFGGIAAVAEGSSFEDCLNTAHINSSKKDGYVGGIVSLSSESTFEDCKNEGYVQGAGTAGGIVSEASKGSYIKDCINQGIVDGKGYTGGIAGNIPESSGEEKTKLTGCINSERGTVKGTGSYSGGIVGMAGKLSVLKNCFNSGTVDSHTDNAGGVAGALANNAVVEGCFNSERGTVKNTGKYTGGVFGSVSRNTVIEEIYNAGTVTGDGDYTAGVFAYGSSGMFGNVKRCYNTGTVQGNGLFVAGICAELKGEKKYAIINVSYLSQCYNLGTVKGTGKDTKAAGITGTNELDMFGSYCSYVVDCYNMGIVETKKPENAAAISALNWQGNENSYFLEGSAGMRPADYKNATALDKQAFESGKAAYLLDNGGATGRKKIWGQGNGYPVPAVPQNNSVYKITVEVSGPEEGFAGIGDNVNKVEYDSSTTSKESGIEIYSTVGKEIKLDYGEKTGYLLNTVSEESNKIKITVDEEHKSIKFNSDDCDLKIDANFIEAPEDLKPYYTIIYDANGGHWGESITRMPQRVKGGSRAKDPVPPPSREGQPGFNQRITGWYTDAECTIPYDFTAAVISDITLYAGWESVAQHNVTFDANGGTFGDSGEITLSVDEGGKVVKPSKNPTREGYDFRGWYTDEDCLYLYDFDLPVTSGFTLYAGWVEKGKCVVVFDGNGGVVKNGDKQGAVISVTVAKGDKISSLKAERDPEGTSTFEFKGWYTQAGDEWDFHDTVEKSMTLTAQWNENFFQEEGEYEIDSLESLEKLRDEVNDGNTFEGSIFRLTTDIKLPKDWVSIGYIYNPTSGKWNSGFRGKFDGGGHTITLDNYQESPVFGVLGYSGEVINVKIRGEHVYSIPVPLVMSLHGEISNVEISGEFYRCSAGVAFEAYSGVISNCTIKSGSVIDGDGPVGGILAISRTGGQDGPISIDHCVVEQNVHISARDGDNVVQSLGGIMAYGNGTIEWCENGADITANYTGSSALVGGIVATINSMGSGGAVDHCINTGNIVTTGGTVGGIAGNARTVGIAQTVAVNYCYSTGSIKSTGEVKYLGGVGGNVSGISNSYWYGEYLDVSEGTDNFGAITGNNSNIEIENCYYGVQASGSLESKESIRDSFDGKGSTKLTAEEFEMGKVAYLIDGGDEAHEDEWTQDFNKGYPVFGTPSMYMITISSSGPGHVEINNRKDIAFWGEGMDTDIESFPDESTETEEYKLDKIIVSDSDDNRIDCSVEELKFKMPDNPPGNVTVHAEFISVEKPEEPEPDEPEEPEGPEEPEDSGNHKPGRPKPDNPKPQEPSGGDSVEESQPDEEKITGGGTGDGDGIGNGTGAGIGEGTGGGKDAGVEGNRGGTSDTGAGMPVSNNEKTENASVAVKSTQQPENQEEITAEAEPAKDLEEKQNLPEPEEKNEPEEPEEPEPEEESSTVFKTIQDNIKENPKVVVAVVLVILVINIIVALIRYKKLKK